MPNIEFDAEHHLYKVDGKAFPSVTTIIKAVVPVPFERAAWFGYKAARNGERLDEKRNAKAALGTKVHLALGDWAEGKEPDPFDYPGCDGFLVALDRFVDTNDPEFYDSEVWTASTKYGYAGTLDVFCEFHKGKHKGALVRLDLKTGRVYPESHWPQLEAYEQAEVERGKQASDVRMVLDAKETGKYRLIKSTDTFQDFKVLLDHYRSIEARKARKKK
jgi:hypothetical protein